MLAIVDASQKSHNAQIAEMMATMQSMQQEMAADRALFAASLASFQSGRAASERSSPHPNNAKQRQVPNLCPPALFRALWLADQGMCLVIAGEP